MTATYNPISRLFSAEDLLCFPSDLRVELIKGEIVPMSPPPGGEHGKVTFDITLEASFYVKQHDLGSCFAAETGFLLETNPDTVRAADFAFIRKDRMPSPIPRKHIPIAPDLVLEVRSPNDRPKSVSDKVQVWLEAGVRLVWELNPITRILTVYRFDFDPVELTENDVLSGEDVLPGFNLELRKIFG